ncbi:nucleotidyltransferase domain-containing protein [Oxalobacteraceae bacterium A2-2]
MTPERHGLKPEAVAQIAAIFARCQHVEQVILYGSRAKGNFKQWSDIDLCMVGGGLSTTDLLRIDMALDDLLLPYQIDLSLYHHIDNPELLSHIARAGAIFYQRAKEQT